MHNTTSRDWVLPILCLFHNNSKGWAALGCVQVPRSLTIMVPLYIWPFYIYYCALSRVLYHDNIICILVTISQEMLNNWCIILMWIKDKVYLTWGNYCSFWIPNVEVVGILRVEQKKPWSKYNQTLSSMYSRLGSFLIKTCKHEFPLLGYSLKYNQIIRFEPLWNLTLVLSIFR